jgi:hypothetical protein
VPHRVKARCRLALIYGNCYLCVNDTSGCTGQHSPSAPLQTVPSHISMGQAFERLKQVLGRFPPSPPLDGPPGLPLGGVCRPPKLGLGRGTGAGLLGGLGLGLTPGGLGLAGTLGLGLGVGLGVGPGLGLGRGLGLAPGGAFWPPMLGLGRGVGPAGGRGVCQHVGFMAGLQACM